MLFRSTFTAARGTRKSLVPFRGWRWNRADKLYVATTQDSSPSSASLASPSCTPDSPSSPSGSSASSGRSASSPPLARPAPSLSPTTTVSPLLALALPAPAVPEVPSAHRGAARRRRDLALVARTSRRRARAFFTTSPSGSFLLRTAAHVKLDLRRRRRRQDGHITSPASPLTIRANTTATR